MNKETTIIVAEVTYSPVKIEAKKRKGMRYSIIRTYSAGVFAGLIGDRNVKEVTIYNSRRLWFWSGAATLSQRAMEGVAKPEACKFPCIVTEETLTEVIEIIPCTLKAQKSIAGVPIWQV